MRQHFSEIVIIQSTAFIYDIVKFYCLFSKNKTLFNIGLLMLIVRLLGHFFILSVCDQVTKDDKYFLVLGSVLKNDKMSKSLMYRLQEALICYQRNKDSKIICSGGVSETNTKSEAAVMKEYLVANGVGESDIYCEDASVSTIENFKNVAKKFPELKEREVVIITSSYHLFRSKMIATRYRFKHIKAISSKTSIFELLTQLEVEKFGCLDTLNKVKKN